MKPAIHFEDVVLTKVDKTTSRYDHKKKKHIDLKNPIIKKGKSIDIGDCYDLFEFVIKLDYHSDMIDYYDDYIEVNLKLKASY